MVGRSRPLGMSGPRPAPFPDSGPPVDENDLEANDEEEVAAAAVAGDNENEDDDEDDGASKEEGLVPIDPAAGPTFRSSDGNESELD
ncbi:hypothetical protein S40285_10600 [Stachybotrys chlorohalonatus IBT 40285]|uniref:Uncharacterized protein n=1 Tax=Stachybotrys chlorohalonatus (strain IBT 40285) TaxID=1283841 RepID=A0A084Q919_STAC4|nr:hypothetical protein S40285_10600 [Stachybotrys chlorohalonata IBT 40285]